MNRQFFSLLPAILVMLGGLLTLPATAFALTSEANPAGAGRSSTVLAYFRFGEDAFPGASIRLDQFEGHLRALTNPNIDVIDLPAALALAGQSAAPTPAQPDRRRVVITVDNAYRSFYEHAWPRLKAVGLPVTLFVATDLVDGGASQYMSWDQIREVASEGVTIGLRGAAHAHLPGLTDLDLLKDIRHALSRAEAELGATPRLFSYPYGEFSNRVINVLAGHGFVAGFGLHSGALDPNSLPSGGSFSLPRFPITEKFGDADRFRLAINALPLSVEGMTPRDMALSDPQPQIGFTVDEAMGRLDRLNCFASDQGLLGMTTIGRRVELRLAAGFEPGRARVNCTMPVTQAGAATDGEPERWRWLGLNFYLSRPAGDRAVLGPRP
ncbi:MAG: polysaccharide deacetylase family protein [Alphaproteobacteria bacterium]|nr:polysaccharide deacetylase family protein [Alphaproteobacteria bacterium SS10]